MNRKEKIALLKSRGVEVYDYTPLDFIDAEIKRTDPQIVENVFNKIIRSGSDRIEVKFDKSNDVPVELMIYQDIGDDPFGGKEGFTAKDFAEALKDIPKNRALDLRINSAGGSVWEGLAIKTLLDERSGKKTASIDGMAASVASWLPMAVDEIRAPAHAQMFIHDAWGLCMGNAEDMRTNADELDKTSQQIASIYSKKTGKTVDECRSMMKTGTLMTGEEMMAHGFIDRLTDSEPVGNFSEKQIQNMRQKLVALNSIKQPAEQGGQHTSEKLNMKKKLALLNKWGIPVPKDAKESDLDKLISLGKLDPKNAVKFKSGTSGDHASDCSCSDCGSKNAPEPSEETPDADADDGAPGTETELFKAATENQKKATDKLNKFLLTQRRNALQTSFDKLVTAGRMPANEVKDWLDTAVSVEDSEDGTNPILNRLEKTLPVVLPGVAPLNIEVGESDSLADLDKNVTNLLKAQTHYNRNGTRAETMAARMDIGDRAKSVNRLINRFKKYDTSKKFVNSIIAPLPELIGPLRDQWDSWAAGLGPRNANTMSTQLLRQVIMSEVMRAFRRQFTSLSYFSHNFGNIPLEGTDKMEVPYYPLSTTASTEFNYANGYVIAANAQTLYKEVLVGGIANGVATAGSGRKYQSLQFTAYEIRRQPWLDIQKLSVMAGEQLAIDVRADIIGTQINAANFGNAIYTGAAGGFDHTVIGNVLMLAAINAFWPLKGRNLVLAPQYYTNLAIDPGISPLLAIGTTDVLREGIVGGLYNFENILHDPLLPVATSIRGGDGAVTAGTDPNLAGYMCWPSAVLVATAPIMPPPGVLKKLVAYEQITDDQTNLSFTYQFFGDETRNRDNEIIECTYGSGLGELAALFRLTSAGN